MPQVRRRAAKCFRLARTRMAFTIERGARRIARSRIISYNVIRSPILVVVRKENPNFVSEGYYDRARFECLYNFQCNGT